jgi:hypothetical protein
MCPIEIMGEEMHRPCATAIFNLFPLNLHPQVF